MRAGNLNVDGSVDVYASTTFFVLVGIKSAATGALLSWLSQKYLGWTLLAYSIGAVFGFWALRALVQGLFVPGLLALKFGRSSIQGPCLWWLFSEEIAATDIDWEKSGIVLGRLVVYSRDDRRIYTRLGWYGPAGSSEIERLWEDFSHVHAPRP